MGDKSDSSGDEAAAPAEGGVPALLIEVYYSSATCLLKTKKDQQALRFLLDSKRLMYEEYDVSIDQMRLKEMRSRSGMTDLPQVFINGTYCGGYDELAQLEELGRLDLVIKLALLGRLNDDEYELDDSDLSDVSDGESNGKENDGDGDRQN